LNKENGCGPWWVPTKAKDTYFKSECDIHDINYIDGIDQDEADRMFYEDMVKRIKLDQKLTKSEKLGRRAQAWFYYQLVRRFGWAHHE